MTKIKIISNPYAKNVSFQSQNDLHEHWVEINYDNNRDSKLLREKFTGGFFPFTVKEILDVIISEYHASSEKIELVFEGTEDEYNEVVQLCNESAYSECLTLENSKVYLDNAREIFPKINEIFDKKLRPLIIKSVKNYDEVRDEIDKYSDVANDIVPICVLGNYSVGKSTFINALIGNEIMPSGAEPVTAKISRIEKSLNPNEAFITFGYNDLPVKLKFEEDRFEFREGTSENEITELLRSELEQLNDSTLVMKVNKALEIINNFDSDNEDDPISDVIKIKIPFKGLWEETTRQFIVFDTPGSNSASNNNHLVVLKDAMKDFSNGIPIFVSEFDALDSTDNEDLYRVIEEMDELDDRFTMIVVNKADSAELDKDGFSTRKEERILGEAVPKHLYSGGLFFVSSVIALGSKSSGDFIDYHYAELFDEKRTKFDKPDSRFYKTLYKYNIMPDQLKKKAVEDAARRDNLLFANSGLFSVEQEIHTFAGKYSAYNKCLQAKLFLGKIIDITSNNIESAKNERVLSKNKLVESLEQDKKNLLAKFNTVSNELQDEYLDIYSSLMQDFDDQNRFHFTAAELKEKESMYEQENKIEHEYSEQKDERNTAFDNLKKNLLSNIKETFENPSFDSLKSIGKGLKSDASQAFEEQGELGKIEKTIDSETAQELLNEVTLTFKDSITEIEQMLDVNSRQYWDHRNTLFKKSLVDIVTGTSILDEEKQEELANIIMSYKDIKFVTNEIFKNDDFRIIFKLGDFTIFVSNKLNIEKLKQRYNEEIQSKTNEMLVAIKKSHTASFIAWAEDLEETITDNLTDYSPQLHEQVQDIKKETEKIRELEYNKSLLDSYKQSIEKMMDWKVR